MATAPRPAGELAEALAGVGLRVLGECDDGADTITLIGPDEPAFWPLFTASPEYRDGAPDALDRWSVRVLTDLAAAFGAQAEFPFGGPPYAPFQTWATRSGRFWPSPIRFLVHEDAGLFASFRGALRWRKPVSVVTGSKPCLTCAAQPCATACPVDAFAGDGYDVAACKAHVASPAGKECRSGGCLARRACPVGQGRRLPEQSAFHMRAFL